MRTILLLTLFAGEVYSSFGQKGFSFKLYQNTDIFKVNYTNVKSGTSTEEVFTNFSRISLAFVLVTRKNVAHEVEFLMPEFSKPIENLKFPLNYEFWVGKFHGRGNSYSLRYELSKVLNDKSERFDFVLGAGINPYYVHLEYEPYYQNEYYRSLKMYGFNLNITPGICYKLNRQFCVDLNIPFSIFNIRSESDRVDDPILPLHQQRFTHIEHFFFGPVYTIRLGLMYSLTPIQR